MNSVNVLPGLLLAAGSLLVAEPLRVPPSPAPSIVLNDNRDPAGTLNDGVLTLDMEIVEGDWHLLGDDQTPGQVPAFLTDAAGAVHAEVTVRFVVIPQHPVMAAGKLRR